MADVPQTLQELMQIDGAIAAAAINANNGMVIGKAGGDIDMDRAAAGNTEVVRANLNAMNALDLKDGIEDILITLGRQYHVIRPVVDVPGVFLYLVLEKARVSLAMARLKTAELESQLTM